jgi:hypothetical protein
MRKRGSIVYKLRSCLPNGPTNSARMRTIVTAALQRQYLQTEIILWIRRVYIYMLSLLSLRVSTAVDLLTSFS